MYASLVNFWERGYDIDLMESLHYSKQYPPSTEMTVQLSNQVQLQQPPRLSVNFEGCAAEYSPQFQVILPIGWSIKLIP